MCECLQLSSLYLSLDPSASTQNTYDNDNIHYLIYGPCADCISYRSDVLLTVLTEGKVFIVTTRDI